MSERDPHLMPIGTFSATTRLSVKALRLYDDLGILTPERVDEFTGYRYYSQTQVRRAEAIRFLRSVDMPLDEIGRVLAADPREWVTLLAQHQDRLQATVVAQQKKVASLSSLMEGMRPLTPYKVTERELEDVHVASAPCVVTLDEAEAGARAGFMAIIGNLGAAGVVPSGAPFLVLHDPIDRENSGTIEACVPVPGPFQAQEPVISRIIAGGLAASTTHSGAHQNVTPAYHAISSWMSANGWEPDGPPREIYLNDPATTPVGGLLTEVVWPMRRRED